MLYYLPVNIKHNVTHGPLIVTIFDNSGENFNLNDW
jgi:hypothetical protein